MTRLCFSVSGSADARRVRTCADFGSGRVRHDLRSTRGVMIVRANPASALEGIGLAVSDPVWMSRLGSGAAQ